ncbi:MAG TPA: Nif3-like dinuclear metal center hexameric protein [Gaiellaceae bacterium]|nr:Nif3-like dinuclear metal center hexameric protein [Gaiellaceae bacterium]
MRLDDVRQALDDEFRVDLVSQDDWGEIFANVYPDPYWHDYVEPGYETRWNGLMVRGGAEVERVVTCVFPGDGVIADLEPRTLLFSEHPVDFADRSGFLPLARSSFEALREKECSFYHVHAPLDQHPRISPSRLLAEGLGLEALEEYLPIDEGLPGGAAILGTSELSLEGLVARLRVFLGDDVPVHVVQRGHGHAGRVAVVAGGGADPEILRESLERGCDTFVSGNAGTYCELELVREVNRAFRRAAEEANVSVVDATHYGTERPPQLAMLDWFRRRGLPARFAENGPR